MDWFRLAHDIATPRPNLDSIRVSPPRGATRGAAEVSPDATAAPQPNLSAAKPDSRGPAALPPVAAGPRPILSGARPHGSLADYDRLCTTLRAYEAAPAGFGGVELRDLAEAAVVCGWPGGVDVVTWATRRVETYRQTMAQAVSELAGAVAASMCITRAIGEG